MIFFTETHRPDLLVTLSGGPEAVERQLATINVTLASGGDAVSRP
jgi:hypothetical protein